MDLGVRNGEVVWIKKDGSVSHLEVPVMRALEFRGFPVPCGSQGGECLSMEVLAGDPARDERVLVKARGRTWGGRFLLSRTTGECVRIRSGEDSLAGELIENPGSPGGSLEDAVESRRQDTRAAVNLDEMAGRRGLKFWESSFFDGYWSPEYGEFDWLPAGWSILPRGDAAMTRRVRKGPNWILMRKAKGYSVEVGTLAPSENIERSFEDLGGQAAAERRASARVAAGEKRERVMNEKLKAAILRRFPGIPAEDLREVLERSRRRGAVGTAQWLYFPSSGEPEEAFDVAADLAVRAHARHSQTDYDGKLLEGYPGEETRIEARWEVEDDVKDVLDGWRKRQT